MDKATDFSETSENYKQWKLSFLSFLVMFGIPIFFYISGLAITYTNTEVPNSFKRFFVGKFMRLIVPLFMAIFILHIPRHFIAQDWDSIGRLDNETRIENDFMAYIP
jgi:fucose 4-O-acetylase-like acetyltransferase